MIPWVKNSYLMSGKLTGMPIGRFRILILPSVVSSEENY